MGADNKSILKKCGEILINIKTKNKKNKIYTFNCAFCNVNCDQLKKFSIHLEDEHLHKLEEEAKETDPIFEPDIKIEETIAIDQTNNFKIISPKPDDIKEDPLEEFEIVTTDAKTSELVDINDDDDNYSDINNEDVLNHDDNEFHNSNEYLEMVKADDKLLTETVDFENSNDKKAKKRKVVTQKEKKNSIESVASCDDLDISKEEKSKTRKSTRNKKKNCTESDESGEDSEDSNYEANNTPKKLKEKKVKKRLPIKEIAVGKEKPLLEAFEKQTYLWNIKERSTDNVIIQKGFEIIAQEVNEKCECSITWQAARKRINEIRVQYANELEKQRKGIEYEMPWFSEHMQFLQENINFLLQRRYGKSKYRRLLKMDESHLSILIDVYKKHENLWQVNNIAFGLKCKKDEAFQQIVNDLKTNHNLDITLENLHRRLNYIKRLFTENKEEQLKCELEKRDFTPSSPFYQQMSFLQDCWGPFKCSQCNEIIERYDKYRVHLAEHDNNSLPFKCSLCDKAYRTFKQLEIHAKGHLGLYTNICTVCDRSFYSKAAFDYHMTSHTGAKPFLCQICGANFRAIHEYDHHIRRHEKRFRYICHICKHGFNQKHKWTDHVKSHLNIRDVLCNICGKAFTCMKNLKRHEVIHDEKKRYKCNVCEKEFAQDAGLRAHRKLHQTSLLVENKRRSQE